MITRRLSAPYLFVKGGFALRSKEYFVYLLSCWLNKEKPAGSEQTDWQAVYALSENHNVTAIIASKIKELPQGSRPKGRLLSAFNQRLGFAVQNYEIKMRAMTYLIETLTKAGIDHLLVKGAVLRFLYPSPELRTSGDTDVVVRPADYEAAIEALKKAGFKIDFVRHTVAQARYGGEVFDLHTELESINVQSKIYYSTPFDDISESTGHTYKLKPIYHLLYVITHIAYHLKNGGAGIRMIMDIDALLRYYPDMDMQKFAALCENIKISRTAQALIALSKKWFKTPVAIDYTFEDADEQSFYENLSGIILDGGIFGYKNGGVGMMNLERSMQESGKADLKTSFKAFFKWLFPSAAYLKKYYYYAYKHPVLLPTAWFHRFFKALFGHLPVAKKIAREMFTKQEMSAKYFDVLNELQIDDNHHYD